LSEIASLQRSYRLLNLNLTNFARYLPREVVDEMVSNEEQVRLGMHRSNCTIMFSDIANFTSLCEVISAEALSSLLESWFGQATELLHSTGGSIDKFIGDSIMAAWGAVIKVTDGELRACAAALRVRKLASLMNNEAPNGFLFEVRSGINSGECLVGNIGSEYRYNFTCLGDTVNLASRLEGLGKPYGVGILVSDNVYNVISTYMIGRLLGAVRVKGRSEPVKVWEIRSARSSQAPSMIPKIARPYAERSAIPELGSGDVRMENVSRGSHRTNSANGSRGEKKYSSKGRSGDGKGPTRIYVGNAVAELTNDVVEQDEDIVDYHMRLYTVAVTSFIKGAFEDAVSRLQFYQKWDPNDKSCRDLLENAKQHLNKPIPADWDGVTIMTEK